MPVFGGTLRFMPMEASPLFLIRMHHAITDPPILFRTETGRGQGAKKVSPGGPGHAIRGEMRNLV